MAKFYERTNTYTRVSEIKPRNGKKFGLDEAQALIGGYVEVIHLKDDNIILIDEDGLYKNLQINFQATKAAGQLGWPFSEWLVGNALICKDNEF